MGRAGEGEHRVADVGVATIDRPPLARHRPHAVRRQLLRSQSSTCATHRSSRIFSRDESHGSATKCDCVSRHRSRTRTRTGRTRANARAPCSGCTLSFRLPSPRAGVVARAAPVVATRFRDVFVVRAITHLRLLSVHVLALVAIAYERHRRVTRTSARACSVVATRWLWMICGSENETAPEHRSVPRPTMHQEPTTKNRPPYTTAGARVNGIIIASSAFSTTSCSATPPRWNRATRVWRSSISALISCIADAMV